MNELRQVYKWEDNQWSIIDFVNLKNNDIFIMQESDNEIVKGENGYDVFLAISNPFVNKDGVYTILIHDFPTLILAMEYLQGER